MRKETMETQVSEYLMENYDKLYRLAYSYMKNREDAMNIVQESVYKAIRSCSQVKTVGQISSWVYQIVIRTALDLLRKQKPEVVGMDERLEEGTNDRYKDPDIWKRLDILSDEEKCIVILRFFEEQKLKDIAKMFGESENTIKSRLYRALKKLRIELTVENGGIAQ